MKECKALLGSTALLLISSGAAFAEVTPSQVWDNLLNVYKVIGYEVTPGSVTITGDDVSIRDLTVSMPIPMADMQDDVEFSVFAAIPRLDLNARPDGTVGMEFSDSYTMTFVVTEGDETGRFGMTADMPGTTIVASGDPDLVTYDMQSPGMSITLDKIEVPGAPDNLMDAIKVAINAGEQSGTYTAGSGDSPEMAMDFSAANIGIVVDAKDPEGDGKLNFGWNLVDVAYAGSGIYQTIEKPGDFVALLKAGMTYSGSIAHNGSNYRFEFEEGRDQMSFAGTASSGSLEFAMGDGGMSYAIGNKDMDLEVSASDFPFPKLDLAAAETALGVTMPLLASDTAKDMGFNLVMKDLIVSEMIWGMLDPAGQLPRDPATLIVDFAGKMNWLIDILDPEAIEQADVEIPAEIHALDINELKLSVIGAELTGSGAFTFDMKDLVTFDGVPAPTGDISLQLVGANGVMDKLVAMGLLPQEQAMGARMMMGMFARPGDGEDTLKSKIEIDGATGAISANGQRLR